MYEILKKLFYFLEYLEYRQTHFAGCFLQKNKNMEKFQIFLPKPWTKPLWKNPDVSTFSTLCFL